MGKKKQPFYRIVAIDSRKARDGKFLENLGTYNPITVPAEVNIKEDKMAAWLNEGATPSSTVSSLLTQVGYLEKYAKAKAGGDVEGMVLKTKIDERTKKTRKVKKAAAAAVEAAAKEADEKAAAEAAKKAADAEDKKEDGATE